MDTVTLDMEYDSFRNLFGFYPDKTNTELFDKTVWIKVEGGEVAMRPVYYTEDIWSDGSHHKVKVVLEPWVCAENKHILDELAKLPQISRAIYGHDKFNKPNDHCVWLETGHTTSLMGWVETDNHFRERIRGIK